MSAACTVTSPPIPITLSPEALSLPACSASRVASQTERPAARRRAAISPPNAPTPMIKVFMLALIRGLLHQRCAGMISSGSSVVNLCDQVYLHTRSERHLGDSKGAAGMLPRASEHFGKQFRGAVGDEVLFGECRRTVHQDHQLNESINSVEIPDREMQRCHQI